MRNTIEFPVTLDEVIECLERLKQQAMQSEAIGDMTPMLLHRAIQIVYREKFLHGEDTKF